MGQLRRSSGATVRTAALALVAGAVVVVVLVSGFSLVGRDGRAPTQLAASATPSASLPVPPRARPSLTSAVLAAPDDGGIVVDAADGDFRPRASAVQVIGRGQHLADVPTDAGGRVRPSGTYDISAYQH